MSNKLQHFGYITVKNKETNKYINAHEFHYSVEEIKNDTVFEVLKTRGSKTTTWESGYKYKNVIASYPHIHFYSNIDFLVEFLEKAYKEVNNA